jgi:hypothetical protein
MFAFVSHKGTSTGCGHYVAHVRGKEGWVLMNDEKVVGVPESMVEESIGAGYVYFYRRIQRNNFTLLSNTSTRFWNCQLMINTKRLDYLARS